MFLDRYRIGVAEDEQQIVVRYEIKPRETVPLLDDITVQFFLTLVQTVFQPQQPVHDVGFQTLFQDFRISIRRGHHLSV